MRRRSHRRFGGIGTGELRAARRQAIGVPWRPSPFGRLLPFRFEMALRFETDQEGVERAGFHTGEPNQFIAVRPLAAGIEENGQDRSGMGRECA